MISIKQLADAIPAVIAAYTNARRHFDDPLYIAWIISCIFDGAAPPNDKRDKFIIIMKARQSKEFRSFWEALKLANRCIENFQVIKMGIFDEDTRKKYQRKFLNEFPEEVPF